MEKLSYIYNIVYIDTKSEIYVDTVCFEATKEHLIKCGSPGSKKVMPKANLNGCCRVCQGKKGCPRRTKNIGKIGEDTVIVHGKNFKQIVNTKA